MMQIEGYVFEDDLQGEKAEKEADGVRFLEERMPYEQPEKALQIYNKMIEEEIFETPLGYSFLYGVQKQLQKDPRINPEDILPVTVKIIKTEQRNKAERQNSNSKTANKEKEKSGALWVSAVINMILAAAVVAMLVISYLGENVTILNYENKLIDKYEQWEQDLNGREQEIRAYEEQYGLVPDER